MHNNPVAKSLYDKAYYQEKRKQKDAYRKKYMASHPGYRRNIHLVHTYGITSAEYEIIYAEQKGQCALCHRSESALKTRLCVDHDHKTGRIRGLLCRRCNLVLGIYENNRADFSAYLGG